jgi:hypothetical protein
MKNKSEYPMFKIIKATSIALAAALALSGAAQAQTALNMGTASAQGAGSHVHVGMALNSPHTNLTSALNLHGNTQGGSAITSGSLVSGYNPVLNTGSFADTVSISGLNGGVASFAGQHYNPATLTTSFDRFSGTAPVSPVLDGNSHASLSGLNFATAGSLSNLDIGTHSAAYGAGSMATSTINDLNIHAIGGINGANITASAIGNGGGAHASISNVNIGSTGGGISGVTISATAVGNSNSSYVVRSE